MSGDVTDNMTTQSAGGGQLRANVYLKSNYYNVSEALAKSSSVQAYISGLYNNQWEASEEIRHQG